MLHKYVCAEHLVRGRKSEKEIRVQDSKFL